ncbi:hypothetical protein CLOSTMETH_00386 [[Clostridium] methylpentosum DSM 5476]|uniref:Uncharacterized protein n=1 Tax=[Clostridium] methylpentosum DSM 5476 TaxID=537013 RepID=C0E989_9FIRM|nr:hypothetical protein CLOSTMETH_00386 [[Clostridium] methylpentosum DSM 5476]
MHCGEHICEPLRPLAEAEAAAEPQQPGGSPADVLDGTHRLVPRDLVGRGFTQDPGARRLVGGIAGNHIKAPRREIELLEVGTDREQPPLKLGGGNPARKLFDCLGLDIHPGDLTGLKVFVQNERDDAAAGAEINHLVFAPGGGKIREQKGVCPKFVLWGDADRDGRAEGFKGEIRHNTPPCVKWDGVLFPAGDRSRWKQDFVDVRSHSTAIGRGKLAASQRALGGELWKSPVQRKPKGDRQSAVQSSLTDLPVPLRRPGMRTAGSGAELSPTAPEGTLRLSENNKYSLCIHLNCAGKIEKSGGPCAGSPDSASCGRHGRGE